MSLLLLADLFHDDDDHHHCLSEEQKHFVRMLGLSIGCRGDEIGNMLAEGIVVDCDVG